VRTWLPWVLLALSLVLNIFFIAGFFWTRHAMAMWHDPDARLEAMADRLDLNQSQRGQLKQIIDELRSKGAARMEDRRAIRREIVDMALQPNPDRAAIAGRIEEASRQRVQAMTGMLDTVLPFLASLSPEQRGKLKELMDQRREERGGGWGWGWGPWGRHRFGWAD
jgi:Spy/CpxP family protein refolding chaperone